MTEDERLYSEELGKRIATARGDKTQVLFAKELGVNKNTPNLLAFADAVEAKARAVVLEQTIHQMQVQMLQMQEQINELKKEVVRLRNENSDLKRELRARGGCGEPSAATG